LLLALQIRRGQQARLIRVSVIESVSPLGRAAAWSVEGVRGLWNNYVALWHTRAEDKQLRAEIAELRMRNAQLESRSAEAARLANLLGFRDEHTEVQMVAARVIGVSPDPSSHIVLIDRGSRDGVKRDVGVITPEGVVGKVFAVYSDTSQVLLLTDKESGVGALMETSRVQGPVRGTGEPLLTLEYISNEVKVEPGDKIVTSGQDRIFPKDLPVGTVTEVQPDRHSPFQKISVRPTARLDGLEEVLVLLTRQEFAFRNDADKKVDKSARAEKALTLPVASALEPKPAAAAAPAPTTPKREAPVRAKHAPPAVSPKPQTAPAKPVAATAAPKPAAETTQRPKPAENGSQSKPRAPTEEEKNTP
jgi:rod shape-determining protein MreC